MSTKVRTQIRIDFQSLPEALSSYDSYQNVSGLKNHVLVKEIEIIRPSLGINTDCAENETLEDSITNEEAQTVIDGSKITLAKTQNALIVTPDRTYQLVEDFPVPQELASDEVMIRNCATGLNHIDWKSVEYNFCLPQLPWVTGREMAGVVEHVGAGVSRLKRGDTVWTSTYYKDRRAGCFQDMVVVPQHTVFPIPSNLDFGGAACLGVAGLTAAMSLWRWLDVPMHQMLTENLGQAKEPRKRDLMLIWGGSTVTGQFAIQLAAIAGIDVIAVCSDSTASLVSSLGASHVVTYTGKTDFHIVGEILSLAQGRLTKAIDLVGAATAKLVLQVIAACGQDKIVDFAPLAFMSSKQIVPCNAKVHNVEMKQFVLNSDSERYGARLNELVQQGLVKLPVVRTIEGGLHAVEEGLRRAQQSATKAQLDNQDCFKLFVISEIPGFLSAAMALESLAALAAAGNILQFVEFGAKLLLETRAIYNSATGISDSHAVLAVIAQDAYNMCDAMSTLGPGTEPLKELLREGQRMASELLAAIHRVQHSTGNCTKWKSFKSALKQVWSQKNIDDFANRLVKIQTQLASRMQMLLLSNMAVLQQTITKVEEENRKLDVHRRHELREMKEHLIESFRQSSEPTSQEDGAKETLLQACFRQSQQASSVDQEDVHRLSHMLQGLAKASIDLEAHARTAAANQQFLRSVHFGQLETRHRTIPRAHRETFEWILELEQPLSEDTPHCGFSEWLRYGNGFYWVQGKAGSGKSTLMKFICQDKRTVDFLRYWAGYEKLVTANFFFWSSGSKLQKTQEGLLRSLLFEVLRSCPELIPLAAQTRSELLGYEREAMGWTPEELLEVFREILKDDISAKFCFFVDGLDEYKDETRTSKDLVRTLEALAESPHVKLCVSSRPWMIFADTFGENHNRFLKLEDLTRQDIRTYVTDKFYEHTQFRKLEKDNKAFSDLIEQVVVQSQGVFLWVFLVVRDLLEGFTYHDTVATLHRRLLAFPPDLEKYFQHIFDSIPKFYRKETLQFFKTALIAPEPLLVVTYSFWDDLSSDPGFALRQPQEPMPDTEIIVRQDQTRRQLDGRCKGLLEMVVDDRNTEQYFRYRVDFLHRTARDFMIESNEIRSLYGDTEQLQDVTFELELSRCLLATIKRCPKIPPSRPRLRAYLHSLVDNLLRIAQKFEIKMSNDKQSTQQLIDILQIAEDAYTQLVTWRGNCEPSDSSRFLGLACQYNEKMTRIALRCA
ncbi:hypothetical protein G7Z17_g1975 [Cylindrodendrum hubeiense]|uniref:Enoyl reductase (ER) domain-containing protein n=1 Tax=Cylindrodendrum hubeiense TaxID=595255 RepID=A0A9P5HF28_9HYPO|nr:hypothetical protein G7Z17_g1975 [Cylindrodendrum hubeiense]